VSIDQLTQQRAKVRRFKEECRMKRSLLTATGMAAALTLALPGAALAHHGHGHHHHKTKAHAHHAKFRFVHIGAATGTPAVTPTTPTSTPPTPENAGTVTSYTGGVLTLTLGDGSTVSGKVTSETRIECVKAAPTTTPPTGTPDQSPGDDGGQGDDQSRGDVSQQGDQSQGEWQHGEDDGGGDDDGPPTTPTTEPEPPCDTSALVAGAVVRAAELRIGSGGTEFESVLLVR
jgi:hypothetical protein